MDFFLKVDFIWCFRELNVRKFWNFFLIIFTIKKLIFYKKNTESEKPESGGCRDPGFRYLE